MELIYSKDTPNSQFKLVAVERWPYARLAQPGDRALFYCEAGSEVKGGVMWATIPYGIVRLFLSSHAAPKDLLEVGMDGSARFHHESRKHLRIVAQALEKGSPGNLIQCYWLGG